MVLNKKINYDNNCGNPSSILGLDTMFQKGKRGACRHRRL